MFIHNSTESPVLPAHLKKAAVYVPTQHKKEVMRVSIGTPEGDDEEARIAQEAADAFLLSLQQLEPSQTELIEGILAIPELSHVLVSALFSFLAPRAGRNVVKTYADELSELLLDLFNLLYFPFFVTGEDPPEYPLLAYRTVVGPKAANFERHDVRSGYDLKERVSAMVTYIGTRANQLAMRYADLESDGLGEPLTTEAIGERAHLIRKNAERLLWQVYDDAIDIAWNGVKVREASERNKRNFAKVLAGAPR